MKYVIDVIDYKNRKVIMRRLVDDSDPRPGIPLPTISHCESPYTFQDTGEQIDYMVADAMNQLADLCEHMDANEHKLLDAAILCKPGAEEEDADASEEGSGGDDHNCEVIARLARWLKWRGKQLKITDKQREIPIKCNEAKGEEDAD